MTFDSFIAHLVLRGCKPRKEGQGWAACCLAHPDKNPSLGIKLEHDRILINCLAGCPPEAVVSALGLKMSDLFLEPKTQPQYANGKPVFVCAYPYRDTKGNEIHQTVRSRLPDGKKKFSQRRPDPAHPGNWIWNLQGIQTVLYRLPEITKASEIWVTEGEADADTLVALGFEATCNPMGAGKWQDSYSQALAGKSVVLCGDTDPPGLAHVQKVALSLAGHAASLLIATVPAPHKDVSDYLKSLDEPKRREAALALRQSAAPWTPLPEIVEIQESAQNTPLFKTGDEGNNPHDELTPPLLPAPLIFSDWIIRSLPKRPEIIQGLMRQGDKLSLSGGSKSYKTWFLCDLALSVASGLPWLGFDCTQTPTCYVNLELSEEDFQARLRAILVARHIPPEQPLLHVWNLRGKNPSLPILRAELQKLATQFGFIVLDPFYKLLHGANENSAGEVGKLLAEIEAITSEQQAAVVSAFHHPKGSVVERDSIDRIVGSGVVARDADAIISIMPLDDPDHFAIETTLRAYKPIEKFAVRWDFPLFSTAEGVDPTNLKGRPGPKPKYDLDAFLDLLGPHGLSTADLVRAAHANLGMSKSRVYQLQRDLLGTRISILQGSHNPELYVAL